MGTGPGQWGSGARGEPSPPCLRNEDSRSRLGHSGTLVYCLARCVLADNTLSKCSSVCAEREIERGDGYIRGSSVCQAHFRRESLFLFGFRSGSGVLGSERIMGSLQISGDDRKQEDGQGCECRRRLLVLACHPPYTVCLLSRGAAVLPAAVDAWAVRSEYRMKLQPHIIVAPDYACVPVSICL